MPVMPVTHTCLFQFKATSPSASPKVFTTHPMKGPTIPGSKIWKTFFFLQSRGVGCTETMCFTTFLHLYEQKAKHCYLHGFRVLFGLSLKTTTVIFVKHACKTWYKQAAVSPILSLPVFKTDKQKNTLFCRPMVMEKYVFFGNFLRPLHWIRQQAASKDWDSAKISFLCSLMSPKMMSEKNCASCFSWPKVKSVVATCFSIANCDYIVASSSSPSVAPVTSQRFLFAHQIQESLLDVLTPSRSDGCASKSHFLSAVD